MIQPAKKNRPAITPSRSEWDFDLGGCPNDELEHCCFYEYSLESTKVRDAVLFYRRNQKRVKKPYDDRDQLIADRWYGSPFRVLVDFREFPEKHWLEIDPAKRKQRIKKLWPFPQFEWPDKPQKYKGPKDADIPKLEAQQMVWNSIENDIEELGRGFWDAINSQTLPDWLYKLGDYLNPSEMINWERQFNNLSGDDLELAANKLLQACKMRIEARHRSKRELVVYEIDWNLRPDELKAAFGSWAETNRPHEHRPRSGGHPPKDVDLLKALGAKRIMEFFRVNWEKFPSSYRRRWTLEGAVNDFTAMERKKAGQLCIPLYKTRKGWKEAVESATGYLAKFK